MKRILISTLVIASIFIACTDDKKEEIKKVEVKQEVKQEVKKTTTKVEVKKETKKIVVKSEKTAAQLYGACIGCHGANANKKALGKSAVIKAWDESKIKNALNGYKNGTYGGSMKGIMKGQVSKLSSDDISKLASYISKF